MNIAEKSAVTITVDDYDQLADLAEITRDAMPERSRHLQQELDRAKLVTQADPDSVRMGSHVRFRDHESWRVHDIRLVYPAVSNFSDGQLSVLTPVGCALLGQRVGSTALYRDAAGRNRPLTVIAVHPPPGLTESPDPS